MAGLIALVGGDEFRPGCEEMDRALLVATGVSRPSVLVVPTAAARENPSKAASNGVAYFSNLGAKASALMVLDAAQANEEALLAPVESADVVYFTGGSPTHLLDTLDGSMLLDKVKRILERGAIIAGSSAGAMVLGSWMRFRGWREALGIAPGLAMLPHHERSDPDAVAQELAASVPADVVVLGMDARTCCFGGPHQWRVVGVGGVTAYERGRWRRFESGESLTLGPTPSDPH